MTGPKVWPNPNHFSVVVLEVGQGLRPKLEFGLILSRFKFDGSPTFLYHMVIPIKSILMNSILLLSNFAYFQIELCAHIIM